MVFKRGSVCPMLSSEREGPRPCGRVTAHARTGGNKYEGISGRRQSRAPVASEPPPPNRARGHGAHRGACCLLPPRHPASCHGTRVAPLRPRLRLGLLGFRTQTADNQRKESLFQAASGVGSYFRATELGLMHKDAHVTTAGGCGWLSRWRL